MLSRDTQPLDAWPKVRRLRDGRLRVKGRVVSVKRWCLVRVLGHLVISLGSLFLLAAALLPLYADAVPEGGGMYRLLNLVVDFRLLLRELLVERFPAVGRTIRYGTTRVDWHLLVVFVVMVRLVRPLGFATAYLLCVPLYPLLSKGFKVTISPSHVVVHRLTLNRRFRRHPGVGGDVSFRVGGPNENRGLTMFLLRMGYLRPGGEADYSPALAIAGRSPHVIAEPRSLHQANAIVGSLSLALDQCR